MVYPVTVVGAGPGSEKYILPLAWGVVEEADLLVGGESALSIFEAAGKEKIRIRGDLQGVLDHVAEARETKRVVVLLSGDPGFFSLLPLLRKRFGVENLRVIPGISSLQLGCARLGLSWHDMAVASVHGRGLEQLQQVCSAGKVAVLTDEHCTPAVVCRYFLEHGSHLLLSKGAIKRTTIPTAIIKIKLSYSSHRERTCDEREEPAAITSKLS